MEKLSALVGRTIVKAEGDPKGTFDPDGYTKLALTLDDGSVLYLYGNDFHNEEAWVATELASP